ncbi:SAM hydrolase/SAM-dependent halogenase family protein [Trichothermofontia sp.]
MSSPPLITLLTDFGDRDSYVGVMKGVIAGINPHIRVIDLTHQIPPQAIALARFHLMTAVPYFPPGTVHLAVVDPGVGSQRRAIAVALAMGSFLVGPDNGIWGGVVQQYPVQAAVVLNNPTYWRTGQSSATFHGRDIFAPIAAHLASGVAWAALGEPIAPQTLVDLDLPGCQPTALGLTGTVQAIDHFGNIITNIPAAQLQGQPWQVIWGDELIPAATTYSDVAVGSLLALIGSHGWLEIACHRGNAAQRLKAEWGHRVSVHWLGDTRDLII